MYDYSYFCGIDLAKYHFSLHAVGQSGKAILHKSVTRSKLLTTIANMPLIRIAWAVITKNEEYQPTQS